MRRKGRTRRRGGNVGVRCVRAWSVAQGRRFCSDECRSLWWYRFVYSETQEHRSYVIPVGAQCAHCGQDFVGGLQRRPVLLRPVPDGGPPGPG